MSDASFADGAEKPIKLLAQDVEDLNVISALVQDAVAERKEMQYDAKGHRFSLLLKRFRWEDSTEATRQGRPLERVQSVLSFTTVLRVESSGVDIGDKSLAFDLLGLVAEGETISLIFAGDGAIRLHVEAIEAQLVDVSRPYIAKAQSTPMHPLDEDAS